ncbi:hypothetical protein AJ79_09645 [Helicocarpus griseus UAMH5409]|uniref:RRM domain-containing protein n=1 Tax=Helicocarpus griseus UAMH5409 TaxID=1447875 RepID=A0A2B7WIG8_9EURO|nr:hypothetical protein AJ79_09645 [Helicocarpus griseus UAMH5409]
MTSNIPDEAVHFRGKTLTPESPRPLHVSEPTNIPLLQNQMDPGFSDTAAYQKIVNEKPPSLDPDPEPEPDSASVVSDQVRLASHTYSMLHHGVGSLGSNGAVVGDQGTGSYSGSIQMGYPKSETENESAFAAAHSAAASTQYASPVLELSSSSSVEVNQQAAPLLPSSVSEISPPIDRLIPSETYPSGPSLSSTLPGDDYASNPNDGDANNTAEYAPTLANGHDKTTQAEVDTTPNGDANYQQPLNPDPSKTITSSSQTDSAATMAFTDGSKTKPSISESSLPPAAGLPPRPPPQEKPSIRPNYSDNIPSFHPLPSQPEHAASQYAQSNYPQVSGLPPLVVQAGAPGTSSTSNGLPPPPIPTFQKLPPPPSIQTKANAQKHTRGDRLDDEELKFLRGDGDREEPWAPEVQKKYDEFLHNERIYVTEGLWDRFPSGSRLFVGNLPTERVTKRDLFHLFHKYGNLAQISIKQAYGFIQFLEPHSCRKALDAEQGGIIRGRKIHLEISKPQKPTRNASSSDSIRPPPKRRSRSPERARVAPGYRGTRPSTDRYERAPESGRPAPYTELRGRDRDEPYRRRDDYRPTRSPPPRTPSPRGYRGDEYRFRDRTPEKYDRRRERRRSRSPYGRSGRYRSPSPRDRGYDNDSDLPIPRRSPRQVPDVQIIVLENVDRDFIYHIENSFRDRGLQTDVLILSPRIALSAVVRRQIIEGVLAIVKLSRPNQYSRKIPLQVFDRSGGIDNVKFNEYSELELSVAAEVVLHARNIHHGGASKYSPTPVPGVSQLPPAPLQTAFPQIPMGSNPNNNITNLISNLDGAALQSLLSALQQNPAALQAAQQQYAPHGNQTDLASLLNNFTHQQNHMAPPALVLQQPPLSTYGLPQPLPGATTDPGLVSLLAQSLGGQGQPQSQASLPLSQMAPQMSPNVQNIMDQLTRWKQ